VEPPAFFFPAGPPRAWAPEYGRHWQTQAPSGPGAPRLSLFRPPHLTLPQCFSMPFGRPLLGGSPHRGKTESTRFSGAAQGRAKKIFSGPHRRLFFSSAGPSSGPQKTNHRDRPPAGQVGNAGGPAGPKCRRPRRPGFFQRVNTSFLGVWFPRPHDRPPGRFFKSRGPPKRGVRPPSQGNSCKRPLGVGFVVPEIGSPPDQRGVG